MGHGADRSRGPARGAGRPRVVGDRAPDRHRMRLGDGGATVMSDCELCEIHRRTEAGDQPWSVARLRTGYVALNSNQFYAGYTFFAARECVRELFDLDRDVRAVHLHEMAEVARA